MNQQHPTTRRIRGADICCHGDCNEGRDCPLSTEVTSALLARLALRQQDGGRQVDTDRGLRKLFPAPHRQARLIFAARVLLLAALFVASVSHLI
jgi:hypothetical protein